MKCNYLCKIEFIMFIKFLNKIYILNINFINLIFENMFVFSLKMFISKNRINNLFFNLTNCFLKRKHFITYLYPNKCFDYLL